MNFNIYDMLVFEAEDGSIYQDCVCLIDRGIAMVQCNDIRIFFNYDDYGNWLDIDYITSRDSKKLKLKEIWKRVDENTYKKYCFEKVGVDRNGR